MFIHTLPEKPSVSGKLYLRRQLRAPLGLADGTKVWMVYHPRLPQHNSDLLISPFSPDAWGDLWRLEIHLTDEIGQMARLVELLDRRNVFVLQQTSRQALRHEYHAKYFTLDCTRYQSDIDGDTNLRITESSNLQGLETELLVNVLNCVRISADGVPRLKVERNTAHLNLYQGVKDTKLRSRSTFSSLEFSDPTPAIVKDKQIDIKPILPDPRILENSDTYFICSCNVKSQILYCEISSADIKTAHLIVYFDGAKRMLAPILCRLSKLQYNIIRSQIREGILGQKSIISEKFIQSAERPFTANLYVEINSAVAGINIGYLKSEVFREFVENGWMDIVQYHPLVPPLIAGAT